MFSSPVFAAIDALPVPGTMVALSAESHDILLKGIQFNPADPLKLEFLFNTGDRSLINRKDASKLIGYFLAALTVPEKDLWVNLSPFEKERVMDDELSKTDLGQTLLEQDYLLKQLSASLTHPDTDTGKDYWALRLRSATEDRFRSSSVVEMNKIWIVPQKVEVY
jgi:hypothetical protein